MGGRRLTTVMLMATGFHLYAREMAMAPVPFVLGIVGGLRGLGRLYREPIPEANP